MASFSSGFSAGAKVGNSWVDNYKQAKTESIENKLFKVGQELQQERSFINAEGEQIQQDAVDFSNLSGDQITNKMMEAIVMQGGNVDDQTYKVAYQVGNLFQEQKNRYALFQDRQAINDAKLANYGSLISNRSHLQGIRQKKYDDGERTVTGGYETTGRNIGSTLKEKNDISLQTEGKPYQKLTVKAQSRVNKLFKDNNPQEDRWGAEEEVVNYTNRLNLPLGSKEDYKAAKKAYVKHQTSNDFEMPGEKEKEAMKASHPEGTKAEKGGEKYIVKDGYWVKQ